MLPRLSTIIGKHTRLAAALSGFAAVSKALGLLREVLFAWAFGTSPVTDAYRLGLSYTTYLSHIFFGEAMSGAAVPYLAAQGRAPAEKAAAERLLIILALGISVPLGLVLLAVPRVLLRVLAPDLPPTVTRLAVPFLRVLGVAVPFYCLTAVIVIRRQAGHDYRALGLRPVGQSVAILVGTLVAYVTRQPMYLPIAFLAYYMLLVLVTDARYAWSLLQKPYAGMSAAAGWLRRWLPLALASMLMQSYIVVERFFASQLPQGSIAAVDYARLIAEVPLLLGGVPMGAVVLTAASGGTFVSTDRLRVRKLVGALVGLILLSLGIAVFARPVVGLLYRRGAFDGTSVEITTQALRGLAVGAWALAGGHVASRWLVAVARVEMLLVAPGVALVVQVSAAILLVPRYGILGLTLAGSLATVAHFCTTAGLLILRRGGFPEKPSTPFT